MSVVFRISRLPCLATLQADVAPIPAVPKCAKSNHFKQVKPAPHSWQQPIAVAADRTRRGDSGGGLCAFGSAAGRAGGAAAALPGRQLERVCVCVDPVV